MDDLCRAGQLGAVVLRDQEVFAATEGQKDGLILNSGRGLYHALSASIMDV